MQHESWRLAVAGVLWMVATAACGGAPGVDETAAEGTAVAPAAEAAAEQAGPATAPLVQVRNAVPVADMLFCGQPSAEALAEIAGAGYRTVLSTRGEGELDWDERELVEGHGMAFITIPMPSPVQEIHDEQVEALDEAMRTAARPIVMHCGSGNRVAGLYAVWLAERQGVAHEEALRQGEAAGMRGVRAAVEARLAGHGAAH